ncbi:MAG: SCO family protein [Deltaproteobacteria bacterium]|nr:SCO family protein [Deltaproteobacteria bacterium]
MRFKKLVQSNITFAGLLVLLLAVNFYLIDQTKTGSPASQRSTANNSKKSPSFALQAVDGKVTESSIQGYWTLFYFGYTFCPDVCPTSLSYWSATLNSLTAEELNKLKFYFVSVDPDRDSLKRVVSYTKHFHPHMNALWTTKDDIKSIADQFDVYFSFYKDPTKDYYTVDHSAYTILLNPSGEIVFKFEHGTAPSEATDTLRSLMNGTLKSPIQTNKKEIL